MAFFTNAFNIKEDILDDYGAFNISLINDIPLFIDPFLVFGSEKKEYQLLHQEMLKYLSFLKEKAETSKISLSNIQSWYVFPEVKQNWFGYSMSGNGGNGLGIQFGKAMSSNITQVFKDLNKEKITASSHIEKVGLFQIGIGKDSISDFTVNLIKDFLLNYTQTFALKYIQKEQLKNIQVEKSYFDFDLERWMPKQYQLPFYNNDYVILTPKDLLTKDETWINSHDMLERYPEICRAISNPQLRAEINRYYAKQLPVPIIKNKNTKKAKVPTKKDLRQAAFETINKFPILTDYYIKIKEDNKKEAINIAQEKVNDTIDLYNKSIKEITSLLEKITDFYKINPNSSYLEAHQRLLYLKDFIENNDGYKLFYHKGEPLKRESDLQLIYKLTWYYTPYDVNREVNNGRGPADYAISLGSADKTIIEFKLASNTKLKRNLDKQVEVYKKANNTKSSITVILYFNEAEYTRVYKILKELEQENNKDIILIDAGNDKPSASNVK